ncbi:sterile alpha motif domain-containing protein 9-like [Alosa alosa]|uniref:sterile alpha motif domain-containing protein 9-like n=1 Tax=Alosa alosa TaxID=278164 RepID=UPI0020151E96|nr:sterile alpha motif domain-containing protein 9-like [Alosa alosa]
MANAITEELSSLDVVHPDKFKGRVFDREKIHHIQANFYKGAPPQWLNFYLAEKNGMPFVKRDGYEKIKSLIETYQTRRTVTMVNLLHQPGSGGSTLAMQVLWDLQKDFWCTKLATNVVLDPNVIAKDVINLVTKQNNTKNRRKPALLLLDNADMLKDNLSKTLKKALFDELNEIDNSLPIIILNCVRKAEFTERDLNNTVFLNAKLNMEREMWEKEEFDQHHRSVMKQYENEHEKFHGFNIIYGDIDSAEYTANVCNVIVPPKIKRRPRKDQLFAILALVNKYAPGSDFLLDQCEKFLQKSPSIHRQPSFEEQMGQFSDLLIAYTNFETNTDYVCVAHPMIANKCVQLFRDHGLSMGEVTYLFLQNFCAKIASPSLMQTTKTMLTMREDRNGDKDQFSTLIQHISKGEGKIMCTRLMKEASTIFGDRPTFPQALARFYYLMVDKSLPIIEKDYINAEIWAREAIRRHPNNSFIMDTLAQVHKHHLLHYMRRKYCPSKALRLAFLAIKAFQEEEMAAEKEEGNEEVKDGTVNISPTFNFLGKLGYLQVALQGFVSDQNVNNDWCDVSTHKNIHEGLGFQLSRKIRKIMRNFEAEVNTRFEFFEKYLTYTKPDLKRDDPTFIREYADKCCEKYVGTPPRVLKMKFEDKEIEMLETDVTTLTDLQGFLLRQKTDHSPELYHLHLLQANKGQDLSNVVMKMRQAYNTMYEKFFRSRYLVPLYMKSTKGWQTLSELLLQPSKLEKGACNDPNETEGRTGPDHRDIEECLMRIQGRIERPIVLAFLEDTVIEVEPHNKEQVLRNGAISFYLGFNIKGPVAFNIKYEHSG